MLTQVLQSQTTRSQTAGGTARTSPALLSSPLCLLNSPLTLPRMKQGLQLLRLRPRVSHSSSDSSSRLHTRPLMPLQQTTLRLMERHMHTLVLKTSAGTMLLLLKLTCALITFEW